MIVKVFSATKSTTLTCPIRLDINCMTLCQNRVPVMEVQRGIHQELKFLILLVAMKFTLSPHTHMSSTLTAQQAPQA